MTPIEAELSTKVDELNVDLNLSELPVKVLKPIVMQGMAAGFLYAYREVVADTQGLSEGDMTAAWIDQVEAAAQASYITVERGAYNATNDVYTQIKSVLAEEIDAIKQTDTQKLTLQNLIMPYYNGWFIGAYYAYSDLFTKLAQQDHTSHIDRTQMAQAASDRAEKHVEMVRNLFNTIPSERQPVITEILATF
ncbi:hypothetical protein [Weissella soli]|uniref:hypothetical protein n=1 Tax=Weissella soli TaxID=155866 RepID=UPI00359F783C